MVTARRRRRPRRRVRPPPVATPSSDPRLAAAGTGASTPPPPLPRRRMWSGWRWGRRRGRGACSPVDPAVLEAGLVWRLLAAAGQLTRGGAVAVAVDALLFEHLWWLQHTPTSSLPSPSWVINSPSSRPLAPPDSVDVIPPLAIVGRRAATPPPLPSHAAGPCRKTSTGHNHRCPLLQQIHATGRRPQSQCDLEVEKLGVGWVGLYEGFEGVCIADHGCGVVLPSWDAGSDRCSGRGDDCFFLGWEPPFANLAAADARISFPVCVPEDLWDASNSSNSDRARLIPAMFSIMYGKVGISADTPSSTSDSFFSDSLNSSCGQSLIGMTCASIIQDTSDTSSNTKTDLSSDTPSNTTMTGSTKRTFNELCFCAKNVDPTADLKKYIEDLECLDRSSKFYAVAVNNTFMKQDRVYCTKEFSQDYLKPLMEGKETISIGVQIAGGVSKNMILHMSTDGRCNLKKGWAKFATHNHIYLQSLCTFHFYKTTRLEATFDVL
uniref:TF-B3 domain-containing protein n=1 Tax=Oryza rufipogon TaxID=4529 RepID=A0A0E0NEB0_ORYRU